MVSNAARNSQPPVGRVPASSEPPIALAWVLNQPLDVYPVVSASSGRRMQQNIDALGIRLTPDELSYLNLARATAL